MRLLFALLCTFFIFHSFSSNAQDTIHVPQDYPSIQEGIDASSHWDIVLVEDSTYKENINFNGKKITLASHFIVDGDTNHINNTIIDGSNPDDPDYGSVVTFVTLEDTNSILMGFTVTGGSGTLVDGGNTRLGGGILCYYANARITHNKIINNACNNNNEALGGGIGYLNIEGNNWTIIENNTIRDNICTSDGQAGGGGIFSANNVKILGNLIEINIVTGLNSGGRGGGICTQGTGSDSSIYIINNTIQNNLVVSDELSRGGGIFSSGNAIIVKDNIIHHDSLSGLGTHGGGVLLLNSSYAEIHGNSISNNTVNKINAYWGPGLFISEPQGPVIISENEIMYNTGELSSTGNGGGVSIMDAYDHPITVDRNIIKFNSAYNGGGLYERNSYHLSITNTIFQENNADRAGAIGTYHYDQGSVYQPQIINNTFHKNTASDKAGAVRFAGDQGSPLIIMNNIFWENVAPVGRDIHNEASEEIVVSYSDINYTMINGPWQGEGNIYEDPLFADDSCHLLENSLCIGWGAESINISGTMYYCPNLDFENEPRPQQTYVDIGADETPYVRVGVNELNRASRGIEIYPNPVVGHADIRYSIHETRNLNLTIYDAQGKVIETLVNGVQKPGDYTIRWNADGLSKGVYFCKLVAGSRQLATGKMLKIN